MLISANVYYWITFINTLTDLDRFSDARSGLMHAMSYGFKDEVFGQLLTEKLE